jgi:hypothetical protein
MPLKQFLAKASTLCVSVVILYNLFSFGVSPRTKFYNEDLGTSPHFPNIIFLPVTLEEPWLTALLDKHDAKTDEVYDVDYEERYEKWGPELKNNGGVGERRYYVADAGVKGWGVFADEPIPEGDLIGVYTGFNYLRYIRVIVFQLRVLILTRCKFISMIIKGTCGLSSPIQR